MHFRLPEYSKLHGAKCKWSTIQLDTTVNSVQRRLITVDIHVDAISFSVYADYFSTCV